MRQFLVFIVMIITLVNCNRSKIQLPQEQEKPFVFDNSNITTTYRLPLKKDRIIPFVSVAAVGDLMFGHHTMSYLEKYGMGYPFDATRSILTEADVAFANLEGPFTEGGTKFDKRFSFKIPPKYAGSLVNAGFDVVTLANNHILDYGIEGLERTIDVLDSLGIAHCGAGVNYEQASEPAILNIRDMSIAVLGYSMTFPQEFWATDSTGGTCYPGPKVMKTRIQKSDSLANFVIVTFHWGSELTNFPKQYQKDYARLAIDYGADLVIGHHPHVLQGIEIYKNRLIAYSLGNFSFASYSKRATESMILKTYLSDSGLMFAKVIPISVDNVEVAFQPRPLTGATADTVLAHLKKFSEPLNSTPIIDENGYIWGKLFSPLVSDSVTRKDSLVYKQ